MNNDNSLEIFWNLNLAEKRFSRRAEKLKKIANSIDRSRVLSAEEMSKIFEELSLTIKALEREEKSFHSIFIRYDELNEEACKEAECWIKVDEAAKILRISRNKIYNAVNSGKLQTKYIGKLTFVRRTDILNWNDSYSK